MTSGHLVQECGEAISAALDKAEAVELLYLAPAEKAAALVELARLESRVAATRLRLMAVADEVAEEAGDRDVAAWCQRTVRVDRGPARRDLTLARSLAHRWTVLAGAHSAGEVSTAQADVIARALDDLPTETPADVVAEAERVLVEHAATFTPRSCGCWAAGSSTSSPPTSARSRSDAGSRTRNAAPARPRSLTTRSHGDGTTTIRVRVPDATADRLLTYLHAWTNPRQRHDGELRRRADARSGMPYTVRLGHAFCDLLEHLDPTRLPVHGGTATTVVVTIDLDTLTSGLGVATTGTDGRITAAEARRLACTAHLVPVVLGGTSEVLDLGRARRLFTAAQRRALGVRDGHCRAEGCDIPAAWCEAHHLIPWSEGGKTDLDNAILLCCHHHHRAHDDRYLHDRLPDGDVRFHRRR